MGEEAHRSRARVSALIEVGRLEAALDAARRNVADDPADAFAWDQVAAVASKLTQHQLAVHAAGQALALLPDALFAHYRNGAVLLAAGDPAAALPAALESVRIDPNAVVCLILAAKVLSELGQREAAVAHARAAVALDATSPRALDTLASVLSEGFGGTRGDEGARAVEEARRLRGRALAEAPDEVAILIRMAALELRDNKPVAALTPLARAAALVPHDPITRSSLLSTVAQATGQQLQTACIGIALAATLVAGLRAVPRLAFAGQVASACVVRLSTGVIRLALLEAWQKQTPPVRQAVLRGLRTDRRLQGALGAATAGALITGAGPLLDQRTVPPLAGAAVLLSVVGYLAASSPAGLIRDGRPAS